MQKGRDNSTTGQNYPNKGMEYQMVVATTSGFAIAAKNVRFVHDHA